MGEQIPEKHVKSFFNLFTTAEGQRFVRLALHDVVVTFPEGDSSGLFGMGDSQVEISVACPHQSHPDNARPTFTQNGHDLDVLRTVVNALYVHYDTMHLQPDPDTLRRLGRHAA